MCHLCDTYDEIVVQLCAKYCKCAEGVGGSMPRTIGKDPTLAARRRVPIRLPGFMMAEVDRIVRDHRELNFNRQQFVESSVREKIERIFMLEASRVKVPVAPELTVRKHRPQH